MSGILNRFLSLIVGLFFIEPNCAKDLYRVYSAIRHDFFSLFLIKDTNQYTSRL